MRVTQASESVYTVCARVSSSRSPEIYQVAAHSVVEAVEIVKEFYEDSCVVESVELRQGSLLRKIEIGLSDPLFEYRRNREGLLASMKTLDNNDE